MSMEPPHPHGADPEIQHRSTLAEQLHGHCRESCTSVYATPKAGGRRYVRQLNGAEAMAVLGATPRGGETSADFQCRIVSARFGPIDCGITRTTPHTRVLPGDNFGHDHPVSRLIVLLDGVQVISIHGKQFTLTPGAGVLTPGDVPVHYEAKTVSSCVHVDIAADDPSLGPLVRQVQPSYWPANTPLLQAFATFVGTLLQSDELPQSWADRTAVRNALEAVIGSTISNAPPAIDDDEPPISHRDLALQYIRVHHTDPALTPSVVARRFGLSVRTLQRAFADDMSLSHWIEHFRVKHALGFLRDPQFARLTLPEIATRAGFKSAVALRRAVVVATGLPPSAYRDLHLSAADDSGSCHA